MVVKVPSKLGHAVSRALSGQSLIGDGMLVRLRSSTLGILGLVAAVGLGLVAFISQQGWPEGLTGPLPQAPGPDFVRNDPIAAPALASANPLTGSRGGQSARGREGTPPSESPSAASELTAARQVGAPAPQPPPSPEQPAPGPQGTSPSVPSPASTPSTEREPAPARPAGGESAAPPVAAGSDEDSPGQSGEEHGHHHGSGPPSWAGHGNDDYSHGNDSWSDDDDGDSWDQDDWGDDDHGGGWGHDDHDDHVGGWGRH